VLRTLLLQRKIATLDELKQALGTSATMTVFRKLKLLGYLTSYSHRGRYYTLREIAQFDEQGLWSHKGIRFSRFGTLLAAAEALINRSLRGYFAAGVARVLDVDMQDALRQLTEKRRVCRQIVSGRYLYTAVDRTRQQAQLRARRPVQALPLAANSGSPEVSMDKVKTAILLFYSLLDEQQQRLYAGLEALKLGRSGDRQLAELLDLDPHTVARGRHELMNHDVEVERARRIGGGRKPMGKKLPK
jgi:hypothetical protein